MILHLSQFVSHLSPLISHLSPSSLWMLCPHDFTFVSHLSPLVLCPHDLRLPPTCLRLSTTCLPLELSPTCLRLSPTCPLRSGRSTRMILHLSPTWLVLCQHNFTFVSHCLRLSPACLPLHSGCSARMILHCLRLSPTRLSTLDALPAWFYICLPLVSQYALDALPAWILDLSPTCFRLSSTRLPCALWMLWVLWSAWLRTCLPVVSNYTLDSLKHLSSQAGCPDGEHPCCVPLCADGVALPRWSCCCALAPPWHYTRPMCWTTWTTTTWLPGSWVPSPTQSATWALMDDFLLWGVRVDRRPGACPDQQKSMADLGNACWPSRTKTMGANKETTSEERQTLEDPTPSDEDHTADAWPRELIPTPLEAHHDSCRTPLDWYPWRSAHASLLGRMRNIHRSSHRWEPEEEKIQEVIAAFICQDPDRTYKLEHRAPRKWSLALVQASSKH